MVIKFKEWIEIKESEELPAKRQRKKLPPTEQQLRAWRWSEFLGDRISREVEAEMPTDFGEDDDVHGNNRERDAYRDDLTNRVWSYYRDRLLDPSKLYGDSDIEWYTRVTGQPAPASAY